MEDSEFIEFEIDAVSEPCDNDCAEVLKNIEYDKYVQSFKSLPYEAIETLIALSYPERFFCGIGYQGGFNAEWIVKGRFNLTVFVKAIETAGVELVDRNNRYHLFGVDYGGLIVEGGELVPLWTGSGITAIYLTLFDKTGANVIGVRHGLTTIVCTTISPGVLCYDGKNVLRPLGCLIRSIDGVEDYSSVETALCSHRVRLAARTILEFMGNPKKELLYSTPVLALLQIGCHMGVLTRQEHIWVCKPPSVSNNLKYAMYAYGLWLRLLIRNDLRKAWKVLITIMNRQNIKQCDCDRLIDDDGLRCDDCSRRTFNYVETGVATRVRDQPPRLEGKNSDHAYKCCVEYNYVGIRNMLITHRGVYFTYAPIGYGVPHYYESYEGDNIIYKISSGQINGRLIEQAEINTCFYPRNNALWGSSLLNMSPNVVKLLETIFLKYKEKVNDVKEQKIDYSIENVQRAVENANLWLERCRDLKRYYDSLPEMPLYLPAVVGFVQLKPFVYNSGEWNSPGIVTRMHDLGGVYKARTDYTERSHCIFPEVRDDPPHPGAGIAPSTTTPWVLGTTAAPVLHD